LDNLESLLLDPLLQSIGTSLIDLLILSSSLGEDLLLLAKPFLDFLVLELLKKFQASLKGSSFFILK
jgi:hypothetical protein